MRGPTWNRKEKMNHVAPLFDHLPRAPIRVSLGDARLDYCDLFAFPRPGDAGTSILIMDVHPSFDVIQAGPTTP